MENSHRLFLQALMSRGVMNGMQIKALHKKVCLKTNSKYELWIYELVYSTKYIYI